MYKEIVQLVKDLVNHEYLYFDTALQIKLSPHSWPLLMWAVCVSPSDQIFLMDGGEQWHQLEESDINSNKVIETLYQRVSLIHKQYKQTA